MLILSQVGRFFLIFSNKLGKLSLFLFSALTGVFAFKEYKQNLLKQFNVIGYNSLAVVAMTALFSGAVLALQSYSGFSRFNAEGSIATIVVLSITRELGPVLAGLMVAGRVGASMAAEIATMRVTEQIDALKTLSTDPIKFLVTPRLIASFFSLPILVIVADIIGVMGGYLVSIYKLNFNSASYIDSTFKYLEMMDILSGLIKAAFFGVGICIVSCYRGYFASKGAQGVGHATTMAVVDSSIIILIFNYIITELLFSK